MRKPKSLALGGRAERGRSGRIERFGGQGRGRCRVRGNRARSLRRRSPESGLGGCGAVVSSRTREFGFDVILTQPFPQNRSEGNGWYFIGDHGSFPCSACEERPTKAFSQQTASAPSRLIFSARHTQSHSPRTLSRPRRLNRLNPSTSLTQPFAASDNHLRLRRPDSLRLESAWPERHLGPGSILISSRLHTWACLLQQPGAF